VDGTSQSYKLYIGALPVTGTFDSSFNPALNYSCPPDNYFGFSYSTSYCETTSTSTLMVIYVGNSDNMVYGMDIILSGAPFPETLTNNTPPFGMTRFNFTTGITTYNAGSF
jgi:hypothetical protein